MKMFRLFLLIIAGVSLLTICGCRNHIQDIDTTMTDYERTTLRDVPVVQLLERDENNVSMRFKFSGNKETELKVFEVHNTVSRFTPYQGWRELYEIPMGLCIFPVGICSHIVNVFSFGIFPYRWCWAMDCYGLTAINPFLNNESSTRFEDESLRSRRDLVDTRNESSTYIMHQTDIMFKIGDKKVHRLTDETGVVSFDLLDLKGSGIAIDNPDREFKVFVGSSPTPAYTWIIPRALQGRLIKAKALIDGYEKNATPENLYKTVIKLEELKFSKLSHQLEQRELKKHDKVFAKKFFEATAAAAK